MDSLQEALFKRFKVETKKGGVNSPVSDTVTRIIEAIPDQKWSFGRWCGHIKGVPLYEVNSMLATAKKSKNPGRHFNWLLKEYKKEHAKQN